MKTIKCTKTIILNAKVIAILLFVIFKVLHAQDFKQHKDVIPGYKGWEGNPDSLTVHIDPSFSAAQKADIRSAMQRWNDAGCVPKFKETSSPPAHVSIKKGDPGKGNEGVWKPRINPVSKKRDSGEITVGTSPVTPGLSFKELVTHELGHALGLDDTKNDPDTMKGKGSNGTGGDLSKHDSVEMKAAAAIASKDNVPKKKAQNVKAITKGQPQQLIFILDGPPPPLIPPIKPIIIPLGEDPIEILYSWLDWPVLQMMVLVDPTRGDGTFYLDIVLQRPEPSYFNEMIGYHYVDDDPVNPVNFECFFTIEQDGSWANLNWMHTYPFPTSPLRTMLLVNGNPYKFDKASNNFEFQLEPGIYNLTLVVDDYQVNSASYTTTFEMHAPAYAATIFAGKDHYTVPMATFGFGPGFEFPPLPAGFFGPGSDPFERSISFEGKTSSGSQLPYSDMKIHRISDLTFIDPLPSIGVVPVEMLSLQLVGQAPVVVHRIEEGYPIFSFFDVYIDISYSLGANDVAIITQENQWGGIFSMNLTLQPNFRFVNINNLSEEYTWSGPPLLFHTSEPFPWTLSPKQGEFDPNWDHPLTLTTSMSTSISLLPLLIREDDNFKVEINDLGRVVSWSGNGFNNGEWYYYNFSDWWNVWFYDHPMLLHRKKYITAGNMTILPRPGSLLSSFAKIVFNYSTTEWPGWRITAQPPLPFNFQNLEQENQMIQRSDPLISFSGFITEPIPVTLPPPHIPIVPNYNPEWLSVDIRGFNYILSGNISHVCFTPWNKVQYDHGDAPEDALAYPGISVFGQFPTCVNSGQSSYIRHAPSAAYFGPSVDVESDGNAGFCPLFNPNSYNRDECSGDGDAGLTKPDAFTIVGSVGSETVVPCIANKTTPLGNVCTHAIWGNHIDISLQNQQPNQAMVYLNVLMDWNMNGTWGGTSPCPVIVAGAPEHVLVNFPIPAGFSGLLSALAPPAFLIGPNPGYVWTRFSITELPVSLSWNGSGFYKVGETEDYLLLVTHARVLDFSDAPDGPYPTLLASNGARHDISATFIPMRLGALLDYESDGFPSPNADGDDLNNTDDEDGVTFNTPLVQGQQATLTVVASMPCLLNAWIDFNNLNGWAEANEQIFINTPLIAGPNVLNFNVPANAAPGNTYARFRISNNGGLSYSGLAPEGEVEDYIVMIEEYIPQGYDYGDAPEDALAYPGISVFGQFPTCVNSGQSSYIRHTTSAAFLGPSVDAEPDGNVGFCPLFNPNSYNRDECSGDGDAGLTKPDAFTIVGSIGSETVVPCIANKTTPLGNACTHAIWGNHIDVSLQNLSPNKVAYVNVLIDWNMNGTWAGTSPCPATVGGAPEHVLVNYPIPAGVSGLLSALAPPSFRIGPDQGYVWARFSITERQVNIPWDGSGVYEGGESEDYLLKIIKLGDANGDGQVNVLDIVIMVNYIMQIPTPGFSLVNADVNGDGSINVLDIVATINIIMGGGKAKNISAPADLYLNPGLITFSSDGTIAAIQFELIGEGLDNIEIELIPGNYHFSWRKFENMLRGIIYHPNNQPLPKGTIQLLYTKNSSGLRWGEVFGVNQNPDRVPIRTHGNFSDDYLVEAYPNPAKDAFTIRYSIPTAAIVDISLLDIRGWNIKDIANTTQAAGVHEVDFQNDRKLLPGVYLIELKAIPSDDPSKLVRKYAKLLVIK